MGPPEGRVGTARHPPAHLCPPARGVLSRSTVSGNAMRGDVSPAPCGSREASSGCAPSPPRRGPVHRGARPPGAPHEDARAPDSRPRRSRRSPGSSRRSANAADACGAADPPAAVSRCPGRPERSASDSSCLAPVNASPRVRRRRRHPHPLRGQDTFPQTRTPFARTPRTNVPRRTPGAPTDRPARPDERSARRRPPPLGARLRRTRSY